MIKVFLSVTGSLASLGKELLTVMPLFEILSPSLRFEGAAWKKPYCYKQ